MASATSLEYVQKMFIAYFGRPAAPTGLEYYAQLVDAGNVAALQDDFWNSAESQSLFSQSSTEGKVNAIFNQLFGRDAELPGLTYWTTEINAGRVSLPAAALTILNSAAAADLDAFNAKLAVAEAFTAALDSTAEVLAYQGNTDAGRDLLSAVETQAQADTAVAGIDATVAEVVAGAGSTVGQTFTLTTGADEITGTSGNDSINGGVGTLSGADIINGGAGTDTLTVRMDNVDAMGIVSNVENITIIARNVAGAADFADVSGVETVTLKDGTVNFNLTSFDVDTKLVLQNSDDTYGVAFASLAADADELDVTVNSYSGNLEIDTTGLESVKITATGDESEVDLEDHGTATIESVTIAGAANITVIQNAATDALTAIDASAATGNVTLDMSAVATDLEVTGGAGDDTFTFGTTLNVSDTVDGGAGDDVLSATISTTSTTRPTISNVEALELSYTAAGTFDARNVTGATSLEITNIGANVAVTRLAAAVTTLSITEDAVTADDTSITYTTGADSAVTLTVGASDTTSTDLVTDIGDITVAGNAGSFTLASGGEDANLVDAVAANDAATLTIDALTQGLTTTTVSATSATAVTLNATAGDLTTTTVAATDAETIALNALGGALATGLITSAADVEVTITASAGAGDDVTTSLDVDHLSRLMVNASNNSDVTISNITLEGENSAATPADIDVELTLTAALGSTVTISDFTEETDGTAVEIDSIVLAGAGDFSITADDADIDVVEIDASAHTGVLTLNFGTDIDNDMTVIIGSGADHETADVNTVTTGAGDDDITGGAGDDIIVTGAGADTIVAGAGDDDITGGADLDEITTGAGSDTIRFTADNADTNDADTIIDFTAGADGDVIAVDVSAAGGGIATDLNGANFLDDGTAADNTIIVLTGASYANFAAAQADVEAANATTDDYMLVFLNSTTGVAEVYIDGVSTAASADEVLLASLDNIVTLAGVADLTAANFLTY